ncbi:rhomboid family intramembrane serine protease [Limnovirga soli]|jgi:membrane associated rhomboid family serine protease|uniref:Rhomboid family intramembrane serine protease n=1 Tax=Limnovirga soli TaxID=2656915 RepID=A0A8J8FFK8_9BACT|nr:rhomboid family intramembrane serine protease [Limnovirga soli]NNV55454.1 rhomboid family intramembrane serine protease [Limnovirga soli]
MSSFRPSGFQMLPTVVKNIVVINALVFLAQNVIPADQFNMEDVFALHTLQSSLYKPWQLITHMFMHADIMHIFFNMFALWFLGSILENLWGPNRFLTFYIVSGLGAALCHLTVLYFQNQDIVNQFNAMGADQQMFYADNVKNILNQPTIGASGAVFGCLAAFGYLFPNMTIYIYFLFPLKAKWFVLLYTAVELLGAFRNSAGDDVAHVAHLGGALAGFLMVYFWNKTNRRTF